MKNQILVLSFLFLLTGFSLSSGYNSPDLQISTDNKQLMSFTSHGAISMIGDDQLVTTSTSENWTLGGTRDGTKALPFVISNLNITTTLSPIIISDTTLYIEITNNLLDGQGAALNGIWLRNVTHITFANNIIKNIETHAVNIQYSENIALSNNTISSAKNGMIVQLSEGLQIKNNHVIDQSSVGIALYSSNHTTITGNTLFNASDSIRVLRTENNTITNNKLDNQGTGIDINYGVDTYVKNNTITQSLTGISLFAGSDHNTIINNTIRDSECHGIYVSNTQFVTNENAFINNTIVNSKAEAIMLLQTKNSVILGNTITQGQVDGIALLANFNTTVSKNIVSKMDGYGIKLDFRSNYSSIYRNQFIDNNGGGIQASDVGTEIIFNYNYWSDYTSPDKNGDGIVDGAYNISTTQSDPYPIVSPNNMDATIQTDSPTVDLSSSDGNTTKAIVPATEIPLTFSYVVLISGVAEFSRRRKSIIKS